MTKRSLLTTASVAVLALAMTSPALAGPNDFANSGSAEVNIENNNYGSYGGSGGDGGTAGDNADGQIPKGGAGGDGGDGGAGGAIGGSNDQGRLGNNVDANSGNTYTRTTINVKAGNIQNYSEQEEKWIAGGNSIDTSGGINKQTGGSVSANASARGDAANINITNISGGDGGGHANGGSTGASANNDANSTAVGGTVDSTGGVEVVGGDILDSYADADADGNGDGEGGGPIQEATAETGSSNGGNGGVGPGNDQGFGPGSTNENKTMGGEALADMNAGGNTEGDQIANGGQVTSGAVTVDGLGSAAGAYALSGANGSFGSVNAANAVAANVNTVSTF